MADAIDKATGQPTQVPEADLAAAWKDGKVEPIQGVKYHVKLKDGAYGTVPGEHLANAIHFGAEIVSPDEALAAQIKAEPTTGNVGAALKSAGEFFTAPAALIPTVAKGLVESATGLDEATKKKTIGPLSEAAAAEQQHGGVEGARRAFYTGGAAQLTGGLSDQALLLAAKAAESTGVRQPGYAKQFEGQEQAAQEQHPIVTGVGEGLGAAGLSALLPGGGIAGVGERGALALTEGLGETAAGRIAKQALVGAARGGGEGLTYGVAKTVSDDAFADHHLTAAHILSTIGANTLYGSALGGVFGAGGGIASEVAPKIKAAAGSAMDKLLSRGTPTPEDVETLVANNFGEDAAPGMGEKAVKFIKKMAEFTGKDPEAAGRFANAVLHPEVQSDELRAVLGTGEANREALTRDGIDTLNNVLTNSKPFASPEALKLKRSYVLAAAKDIDQDVAGKALLDMAAETRAAAQRMANFPEHYGNVAEMKKNLATAIAHETEIAKAVKSGNIGDGYLEADAWRRAIGSQKAALENTAKPTIEQDTQRMFARKDAYGAMFDGLKSGLEDKASFGALGEQQQINNSLWHQDIASSNDFRRAFTTRYGIDETNAWRPGEVVDPAKAGAYFNNITSPSKDLTHRTVMDFLDNRARLGQAVLDRGELDAKQIANVKDVIAATERAKATLTKTVDQFKAENQWAQLKEGITQGAGLGPAVIGGLITHGPIGGLLGLGLAKALRVAMNSGQTISHLATFVKMTRESDNRIVRTLVDFVKGKARPKVPLDSSAYVRRAAGVSEMMANPDKLAERIGTNLGDLRTRAPRLADAMTGAALTGIQFLSQKLPPIPPADPFEPNRKPMPPPIGQRETWLRYYNAVQDPLTVLDDLRDGRINMEGVEVLRDVYPPLFQHVRQQTFDLMASGRMEAMSKQQRIGLGLALGIATPELDPAYVAARQAAFTQQPGAQQEAPSGGGKGGKPKRTRALNMTKNSPMLTVDRLESGSPASLR